jgi:hypothetical protein
MRRPVQVNNDGMVKSWRFGHSSLRLCMSPILKALLQCLRILRLVREYIQTFPGRWTSLLAVLSRRLGLLWRGLRKPGTSRGPKSSEPPLFGTSASRYPVSHSSTSREYVIAASTVPESANYPSSQDRAEMQPATAVPTTGVPLTTQDSLSVDNLHPINPPLPFDGRILAHRSSGNLSAVSVQSRASDRFSVITTSRESMRAIPVGQPSRLSRAPHRQFGRGPDPSRSRDRSRPDTTTSRPHTPHELPRLQVITSNAPHFSHGDDGVGSVNLPSPSAYTHEPLSPPTMDRNNKKRSSTSLVFNVQNPSTDSLPISSTVNPLPLTEEPFAIDTTTAHSSPVTTPADLHDEGFSRSLTSISDYLLPEGRFVQLINSDQVPRYTKSVTMQVGFILILWLYFYIL